MSSAEIETSHIDKQRVLQAAAAALAQKQAAARKISIEDITWQREEAWRVPIVDVFASGGFRYQFATPTAAAVATRTRQCLQTEHGDACHERTNGTLDPDEPNRLFLPLVFHESHEQIGYRVWDGGVMLCKYLEHGVSTGRLRLNGRSIVEIGAGTGIVSMVAACLAGVDSCLDSSTAPSKSSGAVIATDIGPVVTKMREHAAANGFGRQPSRNLQLPAQSAFRGQRLDQEPSEPAAAAGSGTSITVEATTALTRETASHLECMSLPWGDRAAASAVLGLLTQLREAMLHRDSGGNAGGDAHGTYPSLALHQKLGDASAPGVGVSHEDAQQQPITYPDLLLASDLAAPLSVVPACVDTIRALLPLTRPPQLSATTASSSPSASPTPIATTAQDPESPQREMLICCQLHRDFTQPLLDGLSEAGFQVTKLDDSELHPGYKSKKHGIWRVSPPMPVA